MPSVSAVCFGWHHQPSADFRLQPHTFDLTRRRRHLGSVSHGTGDTLAAALQDALIAALRELTRQADSLC